MHDVNKFYKLNLCFGKGMYSKWMPYSFYYFTQDKWIGLLHHICNDHQWLGGQCDHVDTDGDDSHDKSLPFFDRRDKDFMELQKVILNPQLLNSFKYYTRFR